MSSLIRLPYNVVRPIYEKTKFHHSVITDLQSEELRSAYTHCRKITRDHAKTFYMATRFLPNHKQRSIFAIYGLCRYLDDLVDEAEDLIHQKKITLDEIGDRLSDFHYKLVRTYEGLDQDDPILTAFSDTLKEYRISMDLPLLLMQGVQSDLIKKRYDTFEELYDYSYKVASVVGLMTSEVFGYQNDEALEHAIDLGIAMQLTNILRDVGEDLRMGRIYLPSEDLERFRISEDDLFSGQINERFVGLMEYQIARARSYYESADKGIPMLDRDSRLPVILARMNYSRILDQIEDNGYDVFTQRAHLNSIQKFTILPRAIASIGS